ncbi:hypothetical protein MIND_01240100 [Mycena indigotica]|uniref:Uncharacterized protein n=1 Tax=Mycena indigotica TaxID=2126181 RepID=A0A8H6S3L2_9AGAR|nr:uncharacterized protein MIND_01240100 [Mycena indigotica]KAF7292131.1 hypothetical protein MIND_01240100 [Mycena indigotica]
MTTLILSLGVVVCHPAGPSVVGPIISPRRCTKVKKGVGYRAQQRAQKSRSRELNNELVSFQLKARQNEQKIIRKLAAKFNTRVGAVERKLQSSQNWKKQRRTSKRSALLGYYTRSVNAERAAAGKSPISYITLQARVKKHPELLDFGPEKTEEIVAEYEARKKLKATGTRATALGEAKDVDGTAKVMGKLMTNLRKRTHAVSFGLVAPTDRKNTLTIPAIVDAGGARYMYDRHGMTEAEVAKDFADWAMSLGKGVDRMSTTQLRQYCTKFIKNGLAHTAGKETRMNYDNYPNAIILNLRVHLVGWPEGCPWMSPSAISTISQLRCLARAINQKECYWKEVESDEEQEQIEKEYADLVEAGKRPTPTGQSRATRSDKGRKRGKQRKSAAVEEHDSRDETSPDERESEDEGRDRGRGPGRHKSSRPTATAKANAAAKAKKTKAKKASNATSPIPLRRSSRQAESSRLKRKRRERTMPKIMSRARKKHKSNKAYRNLLKQMNKSKGGTGLPKTTTSAAMTVAATAGASLTSAEKKNVVKGKKGGPPGHRA